MKRIRAPMRLAAAVARFAVAAAVCAGLQHAGVGAARRAPAELATPFDATAIDRGVDACKDFFGYATGAFRKRHRIPPEYSEYGSIEQLEDRTREIVRDILVNAQRNPGGTGGNVQKIGALYGSCMDAQAIERNGLTPIGPELARIAAIARRGQIAPELIHLHAIGVDAAFALNPTQDYHDSTRTIGEIDQGGIGLPERDYYLRTDPDSRKLRMQYASHVAKMLELSGDSASAKSAGAVVGLETIFARAAKPAADLRDPLATYHLMSLTSIDAAAPHVALRRYFLANDLPMTGALNVAEPAFLRAVDRQLATAPLATWKHYLRWRLLDTYAPTLPARFDRENFAFREAILNGAKAQLPRWKRCVNATNALLGDAVGEAYVGRAFAPPAKARAFALTERVKDAYRNEMHDLSWMTPATKRRAVRKLAAMGLKVGYPAKWRSYAGYSVTTGSYFGNVERGARFERRYELHRIGRPVDRGVWFMTPQTVNAYNDTQRNEIVLPAAQLQRPFFDPALDDAQNLGATGAGTIGHEMTHGFDDEGRKFDAHGNLRDWWTPRDLAQFERRAQCVIDQFNGIAAVGTLHYQGRLVAGEAIADLGGLVIGERALASTLGLRPAPVLDGFTPQQRYFLAFAQSWSESIRPEAARIEVLTDPHPLPRDRVNATVANVPAWFAAFHCAPPPRAVCRVW